MHAAMSLRLRKASRGRTSISLLVVSLALVLSSCSRSRREPRPRNVLIITLDTLRADRLGAYGYGPAQTPNLDRLARSGARFEQASTVVPLTLPSHSSLFTGTFPAYHRVTAIPQLRISKC